MELWLILLVIFAFVLVRGHLEERAKERAHAMRVLETALQNPQMDRASLQALVQQANGGKSAVPSADSGRGAGILSRIVLFCGWMTMFSAVGVWLYGQFGRDPDFVIGALVTFVVGVGLTTFPLAQRELDARRQRAS
jgi:Flp pilus assembly protein TadB